MSSQLSVNDSGAKKAPRVPSWLPTFQCPSVDEGSHSPVNETPAQRRARMDADREQRLAEIRERITGATFGNRTGVTFESPRYRAGC